jgi:hypothetical protein
LINFDILLSFLELRCCFKPFLYTPLITPCFMSSHTNLTKYQNIFLSGLFGLLLGLWGLTPLSTTFQLYRGGWISECQEIIIQKRIVVHFLIFIIYYITDFKLLLNFLSIDYLYSRREPKRGGWGVKTDHQQKCYLASNYNYNFLLSSHVAKKCG